MGTGSEINKPPEQPGGHEATIQSPQAASPSRPDWWTSRPPEDYTPTLRPAPAAEPVTEPARAGETTATTDDPGPPQGNRRITIGLVAAVGLALLLGFAVVRDGGDGTAGDEPHLRPTGQATAPGRRTGWEDIVTNPTDDADPRTPERRPPGGTGDTGRRHKSDAEIFVPAPADSTVDDPTPPHERATTSTPKTTVTTNTSRPSPTTTGASPASPTTTTTAPPATTTIPTTTTTADDAEQPPGLLGGLLRLVTGS